MELGNLSSDVKGAVQAVALQEPEYRCRHRDGSVGSSDETFVMKVERSD